MYIYVYVYAYTDIFIYTFTHIHIYKYMCIYMYIHISSLCIEISSIHIYTQIFSHILLHRTYKQHVLSRYLISVIQK